MQIRHDAANPIINVGVAIRRLGWLTGCTWLACFRHRCILRRRTTPLSSRGSVVNCESQKAYLPPRSASTGGSASLGASGVNAEEGHLAGLLGPFGVRTRQQPAVRGPREADD